MNLTRLYLLCVRNIIELVAIHHLGASIVSGSPLFLLLTSENFPKWSFNTEKKC